jgi:mRNA interferase MazF
MARYTVGDLVVLPFPFSDGSGIKRRPTLVLGELPYFGGMDYLVCLITSQSVGDPNALELFPSDIIGGTLTQKSYLRPLYLFAPAEFTMARKIGTLAPAKLQLVRQTIMSVVNP